MKVNRIRGHSLATNVFSTVGRRSRVARPGHFCFRPFQTRRLEPNHAFTGIGSRPSITQLLKAARRTTSSASAYVAHEQPYAESDAEIDLSAESPGHQRNLDAERLVRLDATLSIEESLWEELSVGSIYVSFHATHPVIAHLRGEDTRRAVSDAPSAIRDSVHLHGLQRLSSAAEALRWKYKSIPELAVEIRWPKVFSAIGSSAASGPTYEQSQTSVTVRQIFELFVRTTHDFVSQLGGKLIFKDPQHACDMLSKRLLRLLGKHSVFTNAARIRTTLLPTRNSHDPAVRTDLCWDDLAPRPASDIVPDGGPSTNSRIIVPEDVKEPGNKGKSESTVAESTVARLMPGSWRGLEASQSRGSVVLPDGTYRVVSHHEHGSSSRLAPAAGMSSYSYIVDLSPPVPTEPPPFTIASVDAAVEKYLDNTTNEGMACIRGLFTHLKADLPPAATLHLGLIRNDRVERSPEVRPGISFSGQSELLLSSSDDEVILSETFPMIKGLRFSGKPVAVVARLRGRLSPAASSEPAETSSRAVQRLLNAIARFCEHHLMEAAVEPIVEPDLESVASSFVAGCPTLLNNSRYDDFELRVSGFFGSKGSKKTLSALVDLSRFRTQSVSESEAPKSTVEVGDEADSGRLWEIDTPSSADQAMKGGVFIALGSNVGDRLQAIEDACRAIDADSDMRVIRTSGLYETEPMYVENQDRFLNGACEIETTLEPLELLDRLQAIEQNLGRVKLIDKGPRNIDLDILLYRDRRVTSERLTIPHPLMLEREFVLRPLRDITSSKLSVLGQSVNDLLNTRFPVSASNIFPCVPLGPPGVYLRAVDPERRTMVMSILNTTPDSFSDGGTNEPYDIAALKGTVARHIAEGATIVDIGGQSSRPNAPDITAEEEIARVLPAIKAIQSLPEAEHVTISIDTYRAAVAEAAVTAGAHVVNDISAGLLDPEMLPTIARLGCTYVMMHMRGNPHTMQNEENTSYPNGVVRAVASELEDRVIAAQEAGIRRWRLILDPGIGFAKTLEQNLDVLYALPRLVRSDGLMNMPWLVGTSRKGFIGKVTGVALAKDRILGTAATVTAAVRGGADIVRVHDVRKMAEVVKMSDAIFRRGISRRGQT